MPSPRVAANLCDYHRFFGIDHKDAAEKRFVAERSGDKQRLSFWFATGCDARLPFPECGACPVLHPVCSRHQRRERVEGSSNSNVCVEMNTSVPYRTSDAWFALSVIQITFMGDFDFLGVWRFCRT